MEHKTIQASWGAQVLELLARYIDIELASQQGGVIAGQAVASAVSELFGDGTAVVYNDVDIFRPMTDGLKRSTRGRVLNMEREHTSEIDQSYGQIFMAVGYHYQIARTRRDGMLNEIYAFGKSENFLKGKTEIQKFLKSFDFNCVQVGVDLATKNLVWTSDFSDFFRTKELLVSNVRTPVHTAIRWFRKVKELNGVFANTPAAMEILGASITRIRPGDLVDKVITDRLTFSTPYLEKMSVVKADMEKWFELIDQTGDDIPLFTIRPIFTLPETLSQGGFPIHIMPTVARAYRGFWKRFACEQIINALDEENCKLEHIALVARGPGELLKQLSKTQLADANRLFKEHSLGRWITEMNLRDQMQFAAMVRQCEGEHGTWLIGVLETVNFRFIEEFQALASADRSAWINQLAINKKKEMTSTLLTTRYLEPIELQGYSVKELTSAMDLMEEGSRMHHCVGGYFESVKAGYCKILRLQKHGVAESLTVEMRKRGFVWVEQQSKGVYNRDATKQESKFIQYAIVLFNVSNLLSILPSGLKAAILKVLVSIPMSLGFIGSFINVFISVFDHFNLQRSYGGRNRMTLNKVLKYGADRFIHVVCGQQKTMEVDWSNRKSFHFQRTYSNPWTQFFESWKSVIGQRVFGKRPISSFELVRDFEDRSDRLPF